MFDITLDIIDSVVWACAIYAIVKVNKKNKDGNIHKKQSSEMEG